MSGGHIPPAACLLVPRDADALVGGVVDGVVVVVVVVVFFFPGVVGGGVLPGDFARLLFCPSVDFGLLTFDDAAGLATAGAAAAAAAAGLGL